MKKFPNALVLIISVILFAWVLTYVIPQGSYQRLKDEQTGHTKVIGNSFKKIDVDHLSPFDLLLAIPNGIKDRADIIVLILLLGGCFFIIEKTGALSERLNKLVDLLKGKESIALLVVSLMFTAVMSANTYQNVI